MLLIAKFPLSHVMLRFRETSRCGGGVRAAGRSEQFSHENGEEPGKLVFVLRAIAPECETRVAEQYGRAFAGETGFAWSRGRYSTIGSNAVGRVASAAAEEGTITIHWAVSLAFCQCRDSRSGGSEVRHVARGLPRR